MNNQKEDHITFKHDPHCDCGICAFCEGQEDVYGQLRESLFHKIRDKEMKRIQAEILERNRPALYKYLMNHHNSTPNVQRGFQIPSIPSDVQNGDLIFMSPSGERRGLSEMRIMQRMWLKIDSKVRSFLNMPTI